MSTYSRTVLSDTASLPMTCPHTMYCSRNTKVFCYPVISQVNHSYFSLCLKLVNPVEIYSQRCGIAPLPAPAAKHRFAPTPPPPPSSIPALAISLEPLEARKHRGVALRSPECMCDRVIIMSLIDSDEHSAKRYVRSVRQQPMATERSGRKRSDEPKASPAQQYTVKSAAR